MADAETTINTILTGAADVKRIVNTRIYPLVMPQDPKLPAITYQRISNNPVNMLAGYSGLANPHMVINSWAMNYHEAKTLVSWLASTAGSGFAGSGGLLISVKKASHIENS